MSSPIAKSVKRLTSRSTSRHSSATRKRVLAGKSTRLKPATKRSPAGKARARKAAKLVARKQQKAKPRTKLAKRQNVKVSRKPKKQTPPRRSVVARSKKAVTRSIKAKPDLKVKTILKVKPVLRRPLIVPKRTPPSPPPQPTHDEAAALAAFEAAHKEFARGHFADARNQFRVLVEKFPSVSEVTARARTYLAVADSRLRTEMAPPRDADSLYDRGVIELNRGEYVAAQELFERALKREPEAAHIHYGLAATRARLGAIDTALKSLRRALDLQPKLRIRAQRDHDLNPLRNDPEFEQLVFASRD
jgi:tetratricopeptide (TPR) repeat protein